MCGCYNILPSLQAWLDALDVLAEYNREELERARYNVAPSTQVPVLIARDGQLVARMMRWGFVPTWNKEDRPRMINNARAETVATSGMFKRAFVARRCIFLASGFYEWRTADKQAFNIRNRNQAPLLMAGIWERWRDSDTAAIVTTAPNALMEPIHDRMPVMIPGDCIRDWLKTDMPEHYLRPAPDDQLEAYPVSKAVNKVANDGPELLEPVIDSAE